MNIVIDGSIGAVGGAVLTSILNHVGQRFPKFGAVIGFVKKVGPTLLKDAEKLIADVAHTPAGIAAEHALKTQVDDLAANNRTLQLLAEAGTALHALGQSLSTLSDDQKKAIVFDLASVLPDATRKEIEDAITAAQQKSDTKAASAIYVAANQFTAAQQEASATTAEVAQ